MRDIADASVYEGSLIVSVIKVLAFLVYCLGKVIHVDE